MEINFSEVQLAASVSPQMLGQKMQDIISTAQGGDTPYLSDCIAEMENGGGYVIEALGTHYETLEREMPIDERITYKIKVIRDEWGNEPKEGDIVSMRVLKNFKGVDGKIVPRTKQNAMKMQGTFDKAFYRYRTFKVDAKGCVTCDHDAAMRFLTLHGVHGKSGLPMTTKPEVSPEPADYRVDGKVNGKKHVWYHRYMELDPQMYEALEPLAGWPTPEPEPQPEPIKYENNSGKKKNKYR